MEQMLRNNFKKSGYANTFVDEDGKTFEVELNRGFESPDKCAACASIRASKQAVFPRCGRCKVARYCGAECQRRHWQEHKKTCKRFASEREAAKVASSSGVQISMHPPVGTQFNETDDAIAAQAVCTLRNDSLHWMKRLDPLKDDTLDSLPVACAAFRKHGLAAVLLSMVEADAEVFTELADVGVPCSLTQWVYNTVLRSRLDGPGKFHGADPERFLLALEAGMWPACLKSLQVVTEVALEKACNPWNEMAREQYRYLCATVSKDERIATLILQQHAISCAASMKQLIERLSDDPGDVNQAMEALAYQLIGILHVWSERLQVGHLFFKSVRIPAEMLRLYEVMAKPGAVAAINASGYQTPKTFRKACISAARMADFEDVLVETFARDSLHSTAREEDA